jgi:hypothetical protein
MAKKILPLIKDILQKIGNQESHILMIRFFEKKKSSLDHQELKHLEAFASHTHT